MNKEKINTIFVFAVNFAANRDIHAVFFFCSVKHNLTMQSYCPFTSDIMPKSGFGHILSVLARFALDNALRLLQ